MVGKILTVGIALTLTVVGLAATAQDTKPAATTAPARLPCR